MKIAVIGLGAIGSQTLLHLSQMEGVEATGFDRYSPGHGFGASGGENRLFSTVGYDYPNHRELVDYSLAVWDKLERSSGRTVVARAGYLAVYEEGRESGERFVAAARIPGSQARVLGRTKLESEFGFQKYQADDVGVFDPAGGATRTDAAIFEAVRVAEASSATVYRHTEVTAIQPDKDGVLIEADDQSLRFDFAVVTTGPWAQQLIPQIREHVHVHRPTSAWFLPKDPGIMKKLPSLVREGNQQFYAAPTFDGASLKVGYGGLRQRGLTEPPSPEDTLLYPEDLGEFPKIMSNFLTGFDPTPFRIAHFFEGYTDSARPIIQSVHDRVLVGVGFSGLGFKHSPAFGRLLAETITRDEVTPLLRPLREGIPELGLTYPAATESNGVN